MSLDVNLYRQINLKCDCGKIHLVKTSECVYDSNITHNLTNMAEKAGLYEALWRPYRLKGGYINPEDYKVDGDIEDSTVMTSDDISPILEEGLKKLKKKPKYFSKFNPSNGWGTYNDFVIFVEKYLDACKKYPNSIIEVWR